MHTTDVGAYYAGFGDREWQRLERDEGVVEFEVTAAMLTGHLPASGRILDIGGGPGRYAAWLADRGYRVTLADLSPELRLSDPDACAVALEQLIDTADDPSLLGLGGHLLYIGERGDAGSRDIGSHDRRGAP